MLVSVGLPCYNRPDGLKRSLESLLKQTYSNLEIIISNNASPDPRVDQVAREFLKIDPRIVYFQQEKNIGAIANFRFTRDAASGKYFLWLADDDFLSEDYIETCVGFLSNHPEYVLICGVPYFVLKDGSIKKIEGKQANFEQNSGWRRSVATWSASSPMLVSIYGLMYTDLIKKINMENRFGADRCWLAAIAFNGKISMDEDIQLFRRAGVSYGSAKESTRAVMNTLGLKYRGVFFSRLSLAICAAQNIIIQKEIYNSIGYHHKAMLAGTSFLVSLTDSIRKYYLVKLSFPEKLKRKLKRLVIKQC